MRKLVEIALINGIQDVHLGALRQIIIKYVKKLDSYKKNCEDLSSNRGNGKQIVILPSNIRTTSSLTEAGNKLLVMNWILKMNFQILEMNSLLYLELL